MRGDFQSGTGNREPFDGAQGRPGAGNKTPPRLADWLLGLVLPLGKRGESIRGDLVEEFRRFPVPGPRFPSASVWYWHQALRLTLRYLTEPARTPGLSTPRRSPMLHDLTSDLRSALRMCRRNPGTSSLIVMTLALAIGAATIGFAFADLALFRGLPVDDPSRVVSIFASDTHGSNPRARVSLPDFVDFRERAASLERVAVMRQATVPLIKDGQSRTLSVSLVTGDLFAAMGQSAILGRVLANGDDLASAPKVAVLSHRYWQEEFEGRPDVIGKTLQIGREMVTVVGVMSPELEFGNLAEIDLWLPMVVTPGAPRDGRDLRFMARLKPGVSFAAAAAEVAAIGDALAAEHPETNGGWKIRLIPIRDLTGGEGFWVVIALFLLSIGLLIAIATANVSNLVMVRAVARQRELAVRAALGARRGRIVRQLIVEGTMLSIVAAVLAVVFAYGGLRVITAFSPEAVFRQITIDAHELLFVASLALICPLLFSLAPARTLARADTRQVLAAGGARGTTVSTRGGSVMVVAQVALAVVLLMASTLAARSITNTYSVPTGMDTSDALVLALDFNDVQYADPSQASAAAHATRDALQRASGVERVAMISALPILGAEAMAAVNVDHVVRQPGESSPVAVVTATDSEGGAALGLRMLAGSWWDPATTDVAVVSREAAVRYFGGVERAIGRHVSFQSGADRRSVRVVGVSSDVVQGNFMATPARIWASMDQPPRHITYIVKARAAASQLMSEARAAIAASAPSIPIEYMETFDDGLKRAKSSDYVIIGMLAGFAGLALLLASAGLFGVVSYSAAQRTAEFGTRMALGASAWDVVRLVSNQSLKLLAIGLAIGLAGGIAVGRSMGSLLFGLSAADPGTMLAVTGLLAGVTVMATAIPAFRASRIDPVTALRAE